MVLPGDDEPDGDLPICEYSYSKTWDQLFALCDFAERVKVRG